MAEMMSPVYLMQFLLCILCVVNIGIIRTQSKICDKQKFSINVDADAKFSVIMSLRPGGSDESCGELSISAIQSLSTIQWAVDRLNRANFISGVKLGFDVFDDCGVVRRSIGFALDAVGILSFPGNTCYAPGNTRPPLHIGILGPSRSQTTEAVLKTLAGMDVPVISPFSINPDLSKYSNFLRTTYSVEKQARAIVSILKKLSWTYISGLHTNDDFGEKGMQMVKLFARDEGICVDVVEQTLTEEPNTATLDSVIFQLQTRLAKSSRLGVVYFGKKFMLQGLLVRMHNVLDTTEEHKKLKSIHWIMSDSEGTNLNVFGDLNEIANRTIIVSPASDAINEVHDFYTNKWNAATSNSTNDAIGELMCCTKLQQPPPWGSDYTTPILDTVYVLAETLRQKQTYLCPKEPGLCENFRLYPGQWITSLKNITLRYSELDSNVTINFSQPNKTLSFDKYGELEANNDSPLYFVHYYTNINDRRSFTKLGEYSKFNLSIYSPELLNSYPVSVCEGNCFNCISSPHVPFAFVDGDVYIIGVVNLHETDLSNGFSCGSLRNVSYEIISIECFIYTTEKLQNITDIHFGAIVFDDCYSPARISLIISQFMSGALTLTKPNSSEVINPKKVVAVVGSASSGSALSVGLLLTRLNIPFISSTSSSPDLDDRINYPYFLRTVPSDKDQAKAMIDIINKMGWKFVSVLYVANNYGSKGKDAFLQLANQSNICVADRPLGIAENSLNTAELSNILFQLRNQKSKVVVYFGTDTKIVALLKLMKKSSDDFIFLSSEDWGDKEHILQAGGTVTLGSIIMKFKSHELQDKQKFVSYIKNLRPESNKRNPWFRESWSGYFYCNLKNTFLVEYPEWCKQDLAFDETFIDSISTDQQIIHTTDAVLATGLGVKNALDFLCPVTERQYYPCDNYFKFPHEVIQRIQEVTLTRSGEDTRVFRKDGNGNIGFEILNVQRSSQDRGPAYKKVGVYNEGFLMLDSYDIKFYDSTNGFVSSMINAGCSDTLCDHCKKQQPEPVNPVTSTPHVVTSNAFRAADYVIIGIVSSIVVLIIISLVLYIICTRKRFHALRLQRYKVSDYLSPYVNTHTSGTRISNKENVSSEIHFQTLDSDQNLKCWNEAQIHLRNRNQTDMNSPNGRSVNISFIGSNPYLGNSDDLSNSSKPENDDCFTSTRERNKSAAEDASHVVTMHTDSPDYSRATGYSLNASNSFKKPPETSPHGGHLPNIENQSRTPRHELLDYPISIRERNQFILTDSSHYRTLPTESSHYPMSTIFISATSNSLEMPNEYSTHSGHLAHIKKQPRTQLVVHPINKPELPSCTTQDIQKSTTRPNSFPSEFNSLSPIGRGKKKHTGHSNQSRNKKWSLLDGNGFISERSISPTKTAFNSVSSMETLPQDNILMSNSLEKVSRV